METSGTEETPDLNAELVELEKRLLEEPNDPRLWWGVAQTRGAIYAGAIQEEMWRLGSKVDLDVAGERAVEGARKLVEVCPDNHQALHFLASMLCLNGPMRMTLKWSRLSREEQIERAPEAYYAPTTTEVAELYERALEMEPNDQIHLPFLASHYLSIGNFDRAEELIEMGRSSGSISDFEARLMLARIERGRGNYESAILQFRELLKDRDDYDGDLVEACRLAERFEEMHRFATTTLAKCPYAAKVHDVMSKYYESQGLAEEAHQSHKRYCELVYEQMAGLWAKPL
ncbi:MAG: hypothetical protein JST51_01975 [Armatimonadetes bacterium]|nr:hypothetical protein [Armatimonadota bacterium]